MKEYSMHPEVESSIIPATSKNTPNSPKELQSLEKLIGPVPAPLKKLMSNYGSFAFSKPAFVVGTPFGDLPLLVFYSATDPYGIAADIEDFDELEENNLVPFADDVFNDRYAYSKQDQSVWFLDTTYELGLQQISPDIETFLNSIRIQETE